ncbi:MAG: protein TolQ [Methylotenera sp.]|nr:protein TolQ [Oligoflexia bacterium]
MQNGIFDLVMSAGPVGKMVLIMLLFISIMCWAIIFTKWRVFKQAMLENTKFLQFFWQSKSIDEILAQVDSYPHSPVAAVFRAGVKELKKLPNSETLEDLRTDNITRALMRSSTYEISILEKNIGWLATTASAAPFIGLFGTVWGIMSSFQSIGASGSASLAVVAPGVSEALITTATGIGAAIPASIFYNYFVGQIKKHAVEVDGFSQDFLNIIERSAMGARRGN